MSVKQKHALAEAIYGHLLYGQVEAALAIYREQFPDGSVEDMYAFMDESVEGVS